MLSDPLVIITWSPTAAVYTTGTSCNFRKTANGTATSIDGIFTPDQPAFASVRQRRRKYQNYPGVPSDFTFRLERHFNVPAVNGMAQPDVPLITETRVLSYPQYHSVSDCRAQLNANAQQAWVYFDRLQAGEGI